MNVAVVFNKHPHLPPPQLEAIGGEIMRLFDGATFASFKRKDAPIVWITASDIYHGTPFLFSDNTTVTRLQKQRVTFVGLSYTHHWE